ncbi:MAG: hypothetical protein JXA03_03385, partial [Bacteroidales bacterium]|nr:hypothetical protein [Bacteroidales bacterium]
IYNFLDELQVTGIVDIRSAVKPYSRIFIAQQLNAALQKKEELSKRQSDELEFYLLEFKPELSALPDYDPRFDIFKKNRNLAFAVNPLGGYYKDSLFTMAVKPIWGIDYYFNKDKNIYHRWGGAEAFAYIGKHWGFYASLRDNSESERMCESSFFTQRQGGPYKELKGGAGDYSEMRGGISYTWKWGDFSLAKDHINWGNAYNGTNILSGRTPSFAHIKLHLKPVKWFEFNYFHGWLVSEIVDSARSYYYNNGDYREVFHQKYLAANMFTFTPFKRLHFSLGNSIVYSDIGVHPAYLIPVAFFKSIDHTLNGISNQSGQNSQMFFDLSSTRIKNLHLYGTLFLDDLSIGRLSDPDRRNPISYKAGAKLSNYPVKNLSALAEYTYTIPITYQHNILTTTFESNYYNMGHYLRDNSEEVYAEISYKPLRGLTITVSYLNARHGDDYIYGEEEDPESLPVLKNILYENTTVAVRAVYEFINNAYVFAGFMNSDVYDEKEIRAPEFFRGKKSILNSGFNIGF